MYNRTTVLALFIVMLSMAGSAFAFPFLDSVNSFQKMGERIRAQAAYSNDNVNKCTRVTGGSIGIVCYGEDDCDIELYGYTTGSIDTYCPSRKMCSDYGKWGISSGDAPGKSDTWGAGLCCGDDSHENYVVTAGRGACCPSPDDTVDTSYQCVSSSEPEPACTDGQTRDCAKQLGVCAGSTETCTGGEWPGCDASTYISHDSRYESTESSCGDSLDNDCDGVADCGDSNCDGDSACATGSCTGTATACLDVGSSDCGITISDPQYGCYLYTPTGSFLVCGGTAIPCQDLTTETKCSNQLGCSWTEPEPEPTCTDSDGGTADQIYVYGTVTDSYGQISDRCFVKTSAGSKEYRDCTKNESCWIKEGSCEGSNYVLKDHYCDYGCTAGQCLQAECAFDTDCAAGEVCDLELGECVPDQQVDTTCTDTDGHLTYHESLYVSGSCSDSLGNSFADTCDTATVLKEAVCHSVTNECQYNVYTHDCLYGCENGRCLEQEPICTGTATACLDVDNPSCGASVNEPQYGCYLYTMTTPFCIGTATACHDLATETECNNQLGCSWGSEPEPAPPDGDDDVSVCCSGENRHWNGVAPQGMDSACVGDGDGLSFEFHGTATGNCCGDDANEHYFVSQYRDSDIPFIPELPVTDACCSNAYACVFNGQCYEQGSLVDVDGDGANEKCSSLKWQKIPNDNKFMCTEVGDFSWGLMRECRGDIDCDDAGGYFAGIRCFDNTVPLLCNNHPDFNGKWGLTTGDAPYGNTFWKNRCCGDDTGEHYNYRQTQCNRDTKGETERGDCIGCECNENDYPGYYDEHIIYDSSGNPYETGSIIYYGFESAADEACCDKESDCVYDGECYDSGNYLEADLGTSGTGRMFCWGQDKVSADSWSMPGTWWDCDNSEQGCESLCGLREGVACTWAKAGEEGVGEYNNMDNPECCGDDDGEYLITSIYTDISACCDSPDKWVDKDGNCQEPECYSDSDCNTNNYCINNRCFANNADNLYISLATLDSEYFLEESIGLTDPPEQDVAGTQSNPSDIVLNENNEISNSEIYTFVSEGETTITDQINKEEVIYSDQDSLIQPKFKGYIVKFEQEPIIAKKTKLEKEAVKMYSNYPFILNPIRVYNSLIIENHKEKINEEHAELKNIIKTKIADARKLSSQKTFSELDILGEYERVFNGIALDVSSNEAQEIEKTDGVKGVYPNYEVNINLMDSVPLINADDAWQLDADGNDCAETGKQCLTGEGVTIAIIDTGIDYTHGDLGGCFGQDCKVIGGYDFVNNDDDPMDDHGHGTHCAGIAAGNGALKGVAPDAKLYAFKVLNSDGSGWNDDIIAAIERSYDLDGDGFVYGIDLEEDNPNDIIDIISLSLGGSGNPDDPMSTAIDNAADSGVVAVIAAGNSGPGKQTINSPGTARKAITVGASDKRDTSAYFSSRGPVIWEDKETGETLALIKPDVVAPGVNICSAQWNSAWQDRQCLDEEHTAISGTSMATPHVAGAVALLKQKNPDWSPEEIKLALRNTALNIWEGIYTQGYGRLDILNAINLPFKPCIAKIDLSGEISGTFDITGSAYCKDFSKYELYYLSEYSGDFDLYSGDFDPFSGELFYSSTQEIVEGDLYPDFDSLNKNDGTYAIKLVVTDSHGDKSGDVAIFEINNYEITSVGDTGNYVNEKATIRGEIKIANYESYKIDSMGVSEGEWNEICYNQGTLDGDILCDFDFSSFENGKYFLKLSVLKDDVWLEERVYFEVAVIKELMDNWPIRTDCELLSETISDLDKDGNSEIIGVSRSECGVGWFSGENNIDIYKSDGSYRSFNELYKDEDFINPLIYVEDPAILNENIALKGSNGYLGIIDSYGNYQNNWPYIFGGNLEPAGPWTIDKETGKMFIILVDFWSDENNPEAYLYGFDVQGNTLNNFPIKIEKEDGFEYLFVVNQIGLIKNNEENYLGVLLGNFNRNSKGDGSYPTLYFDIYSTAGERVSRTYIYENNKRSGINNGVGLTYFVSGDLNNDGNDEIVISYYFIDSEMFFEDMHNLEAYNTYVDVIGSQGGKISTLSLDEMKGYKPMNVVIGNLGREKLDIIISFSDTFPTTYDGQKIIAFDYLGDELFTITLDDYNKLIYGLSVGDVDGAGESEIVINHRPRWWEGDSSGILIYNNQGILQKEIEIPTFGSVNTMQSTSPILFDFDNDGKTEIFQNTLYLAENPNSEPWKSDLFVFELDAPYNPDDMDWPMFQHDPQHTGCYDCDELPQSKVVNNGGEDIAGTLVFQIQKKDASLDWQDMPDKRYVFRDQIIPARDLIKLDLIFNPLEATVQEEGEYRVCALFNSENVGVADCWEFDVESQSPQ